MSEGEGAAAPTGGEGEGTPGAAAAILGGTPTGGDPAGQAAPAGGEAPKPWYDGLGLSSDDISSIESKGWHSIDPGEGRTAISEILSNAVKAYKNTERLRGVPADQLVKKPSDASDPEQVAEYQKALGIPESAEGYEIPDREVGGNPLDKEALAKVAHALGLMPGQAERLPDVVAYLTQSAMDQEVGAKQAAGTAATTEWQGAQGQALEQNTLLADKGFGQTGITAEALDALRGTSPDVFKGVMDLAVMAGRLLSEGRRGDDGQAPSGAPQSYALTPKEAIARKNELAGQYAKATTPAERKRIAEQIDRISETAHY